MSKRHKIHYDTPTAIGTLCRTLSRATVNRIENVTCLRCLDIHADQVRAAEMQEQNRIGLAQSSEDDAYRSAAFNACREADIPLTALQSGILTDILQLLNDWPGFTDDATIGDPWAERLHAITDQLKLSQ